MSEEKTNKLLLTYPKKWMVKIEAMRKTYGMQTHQQVIRYILAGIFEPIEVKKVE